MEGSGEGEHTSPVPLGHPGQHFSSSACLARGSHRHTPSQHESHLSLASQACRLDLSHDTLHLATELGEMCLGKV